MRGLLQRSTQEGMKAQPRWEKQSGPEMCSEGGINMIIERLDVGYGEREKLK